MGSTSSQPESQHPAGSQPQKPWEGGGCGIRPPPRGPPLGNVPRSAKVVGGFAGDVATLPVYVHVNDVVCFGIVFV